MIPDKLYCALFKLMPTNVKSVYKEFEACKSKRGARKCAKEAIKNNKPLCLEEHLFKIEDAKRMRGEEKNNDMELRKREWLKNAILHAYDL